MHAARGLAVIFITHHVEEVVEVADRVSLMKDGALVESFVMSEHTDADFIVGKLVGKSRSRLGGKQTPTVWTTRSSRSMIFRRCATNALRSRSLPAKSSDFMGSSVQVAKGLAEPLSGWRIFARARCSLWKARIGPASPAAAARAGVSYLPSGRAANCVLPSRSTRENLMISQLDQVQSFGIIEE